MQQPVLNADPIQTALGEELPPFEPPLDYRFEPELTGPTPRPVPEKVKHGLWARSQRFTFHVLFACALLCTVLQLIPWVRDAGLYFLPFAYLHWIAGGLALLAIGSWALQHFGPTPMIYIEHGVPTIGRVLDQVKQPGLIVNGQASNYHFIAQVEFQHPETGEHLVMEARSDEFSADKRHQYETTYRLGDYITLVHLPGQPLDSLRPYGFLGLSPDVGVRQVGKSTTFWQILVIGIFFVLFLGVSMWNIYVFQVYDPLDYQLTELVLPMVLGAVLVGGSLLAFLAYEHRRELRKQAERNRKALEEGGAVELGSASLFAQTSAWNRVLQVIVVVGALLLGALSGVCAAFTANALLDDGTAHFVAIEIDDVYEETHSFVFREYYVAYRLADDPPDKKRNFYTTPERLAALMSRPGPFQARIRPGHFGWPWIETLEAVDD